jgi:hypothetical protein
MSKKGKLSKIGRSDKAARHVRIYHWFQNTAAWQSLVPNDRCLYIELLTRYGGPGSNNGRIPYSIREAAKALHIGKSTAAESFRRLEERGFIRPMQKGKFDRKRKHSTEWCLTEFPCDLTGEPPTKDFARWRGPHLNPVSEVGPAGLSGRTAGPLTGTAPQKRASHGI